MEIENINNQQGESSKKLWERLSEDLDFASRLFPQGIAINSRFIEIAKGKAVSVLPWNEKLLFDKERSIMASGAVVTLIDQTCGLACMSTFDEPMAVATLDLRIDYMRPGRKGHEIRVVANCYRVTHHIAFVRANAFDSDNEEDIIATAQAAFMITPEKKIGT